MSDDEQERFDELCEHVHGDLAARIGAFDGSMLVKYLACVEVIGDDGDRAVFSVASKDMKTWDSLGLIEFVRQLEQAGAVNEGRNG